MKTYRLRKYRSVNNRNGYEETYVEGSLEYLTKCFYNLLELGYEYDKSIKLNPRTAKELVSGLNKTAYENRDYFTEWSLA